MIIKPYFTERTIKQAELGRYTFVVPVPLSKTQVRKIIEDLFKVKVTKVTTSTKKGVKTTARSGKTRKYITAATIKLATVYLKDKQTIDLFKTK